ncbi:hypothetical protein LG943_03510 [Streptomonospora sp. S1-112]|uniref:Uncharacterized protein n=1 Tax=Streptomonospora mangrovi TaxID=2883123 RepID=A0A9X3NH76_9ACTN|nr:hypothetical protein [Streptomonospora mangrovi]
MANLGGTELVVVIDGAAVGAVEAGAQESFPLAPGEHTLQARAAGGATALRRLTLEPGGTARAAFEAPGGGTAPHHVETAVFTPSRGAAVAGATGRFTAGSTGLGAGVGAAMGAFFFVSDMLSGQGGLNEYGWAGIFIAAPAVAVIVGVLFGAGGILFGALSGLSETRGGAARDPRHRLALDATRLSFRRGAEGAALHVAWAGVERVGLVEDPRGAALVVWYAPGRTPPAGAERLDGGAVVCRLREVGAAGASQRRRLRAALRWFAGRRYAQADA